MKETEKHHLFWLTGCNPITMWLDTNISKEQREKRNKKTWDDNNTTKL